VESAAEGIHLGMNDYIIKPANVDVLAKLVADELAAGQSK
jgi:ActR/RegA family two-component response regulator